MSVERNGRTYGDHTLVGDNNDSFFDQSWIQKAQDLGWSDGCPVVTRLTKSPEEGGKGDEVMAKRYGQVNYWAGAIKEIFQKAERYDLLDQFTLQRPRRDDEPLGTHDADWVPDELHDHMLVTPELYSLPRIVIAYIDDPTLDHSIPEKQTRLTIAIKSIEKASREAQNIKEAMISVVQSLVEQGGNALMLLKNALPQGKIGEDTVYAEYYETLSIMREKAPELYNIYNSLPIEEKQKVGMAVL